ncbi:MAG TPA: VCBS repeat-containing protein [Pyrinomonadaceae bacterium]|nr:VCBS repeat-containing protein [Pyrinomonadaceae bacterium]
MKRMSYVGRFGLLALVVFSLTFPASAQVGLRNALDFDGDGRADYYIWGILDSTWYIRTENDTNFVHPFGDIAIPEFPSPGDYDGDGKGEMAVFNDSTGVWTLRESSTGAVVTKVFGQLFDIPVARDYDGDGKTDIAVIRDPDPFTTGNTLEWRVLPSDGPGETVQPWGLDTHFVAPGDYDGDGRYDLAVYHPNGGNTNFDIQFSAGGTVTIQLTGNDFTDASNPGDYDGDGKTDAALTREGPGSTVLWVIKRSSDGAEVTFTWGNIFSDFIVQNDYNGDGRTELAVWRLTDAKFYIMDAVDSSVNQVPWGIPNDVPVAAYDTHP